MVVRDMAANNTRDVTELKQKINKHDDVLTDIMHQLALLGWEEKLRLSRYCAADSKGRDPYVAAAADGVNAQTEGEDITPRELCKGILSPNS